MPKGMSPKAMHPKVIPMMNAMKPTREREMVVSALLLFLILILVTIYPVNAQSQIGRPFAPTPGRSSGLQSMHPYP